jgi:hypothetical protein
LTAILRPPSMAACNRAYPTHAATALKLDLSSIA